MYRKHSTYNEVLGRDKDGSIVVFDEVFEYPYGLKGAAGTRFEVVSRGGR